MKLPALPPRLDRLTIPISTKPFRSTCNCGIGTAKMCDRKTGIEIEIAPLPIHSKLVDAIIKGTVTDTLEIAKKSFADCMDDFIKDLENLCASPTQPKWLAADYYDEYLKVIRPAYQRMKPEAILDWLDDMYHLMDNDVKLHWVEWDYLNLVNGKPSCLISLRFGPPWGYGSFTKLSRNQKLTHDNLFCPAEEVKSVAKSILGDRHVWEGKFDILESSMPKYGIVEALLLRAYMVEHLNDLYWLLFRGEIP